MTAKTLSVGITSVASYHSLSCLTNRIASLYFDLFKDHQVLQVVTTMIVVYKGQSLPLTGQFADFCQIVVCHVGILYMSSLLTETNIDLF